MTAPRRCGECSLCCKLLPVPPIGKPAGKRCEHQRHSGCAIYKDRPVSCRLWSCRWLTGQDTDGMPRPDRAGYVIDMMPDFVRISTPDDAGHTDIPSVQVWVDPARPDSWRTPEMMAFIERKGSEGMVTILRFGSTRGVTVAPPTISSDKQWHEVESRNNPELLEERKRRYGY